MEQNLPPFRGRGAALLEAIKKRKEEREKVVGVADVSASEEDKAPRGRAALLLKLREERLKRIGTEGTPPSVKPKPSEPQTIISKELGITEITQSVSEASLTTEKDAVTYRGETGTPLSVCVNYIRVHVKRGLGVYEYEVKFNPDLDARNRRLAMVNKLMKHLGTAKIFDGGSCLYLPDKITDTQKVFNETLTFSEGEMEIATTLTFKKKKSMGDQECLHLYNVLFKRIMFALLYTRIGFSYYYTDHRYLIPQHKLEVYPGFAISVDELEDGLMLCLDSRHHVLRTETVHELLMELRTLDPRRFKELAQSNIIGAVVWTGYNNKSYRIDDISWEMTPMDTFETRSGETITIFDYFKQHHNITIADVDQPLLIHRSTVKNSGSSEKTEKMICLIPELSQLTGLSETMRNNFQAMKDIAHHTRVTPNQRIQALRTFLENVKKSEKAQQILDDWGLKLDTGSVALNGRRLENETVYFGNNRTHCSDNADWNRAVGENRIIGPVDLHNWIVFYTERDTKSAHEFAENMVRFGGVMGYRAVKPRLIKLADDRTHNYMQACREHLQGNVQIVVFICPTLRTDRYEVIKKITCAEIPVPSQVILGKTLSNPKKVRSISQKIALQMMCKMGGSLWTVRIPFKKWMIIGIDVYHGSPNNSVCGFVASLDDTVTRWFSLAIFQKKEVGDFLKVAFTKALQAWKNENESFPLRIIVIRDGVGDGQLDYCKRYEIPQFESVLTELKVEETKLCFIVVQKRINTRIFAQGRDLDNPPPGTVLDQVVTRRYMHDFFLIPQTVRQGTVNPTHYIVLHDTCGLKPDQAQRLCYKLCHLYYNWPGTIRVPAPCQYAHKLAGLVGQYIQKPPSAQLANKLFYL